MVSDYDSLKAQMIKYFLTEVCTFFLDNAIAHLIDYSINLTFLCTGKPEIHWTHFTVIIHFIGMVWD